MYASWLTLVCQKDFFNKVHWCHSKCWAHDGTNRYHGYPINPTMRSCSLTCATQIHRSLILTPWWGPRGPASSTGLGGRWTCPHKSLWTPLLRGPPACRRAWTRFCPQRGKKNRKWKQISSWKVWNIQLHHCRQERWNPLLWFLHAAHFCNNDNYLDF